MRQHHQDRSRRGDRYSFGSGAGGRRTPTEPFRLGQDFKHEDFKHEDAKPEYAEPEDTGSDYARSGYAGPEDCMPLFISDRDGEPDPNEYIAAPVRGRRTSSITARLLAGVCAASIAAVLSGWFSSDAARDFFRASFADLIPAPLAATPPVPPPLVDKAAAVPAPLSAQEKGPIVAKADAKADIGSSQGTANAPDPSHGSLPAAVEAPKPTPPMVHHLNPGEIAAALSRADGLIASGDIAAARLVLERAAESEDATAAIKLAGTYDPAILSQLGVHGIVPDPAKAREWYEKARKYGAPDAANRLEALAGKRH